MLQAYLLRARRLAVTSALASAHIGCSFIFVTPPSSSGSSRSADDDACTTSKAAPVIDTLVGGYQVFRTGFAIAASDEVYEDAPISRPVDITMGVALSTLFISSAIYGYSKTSRCKEARHRYHYTIDEEPEEDDDFPRRRRRRTWE